MNGPSLRRGALGGAALGEATARAPPPPLRFSAPLLQRFKESIININTLIHSPNVNNQLDYLKSLVKQAKDGNDETYNESIVQFLINIFLESPPNHPVKKTCSRLLTSQLNVEHLETLIFSELLKIISATEFDDGESLNDTCNSIAGCFDIYPQADDNKETLLTILIFLKSTLRTNINTLKDQFLKLSPTKKMEIYSYIHNTNRILLAVVQRNCSLNFILPSELTELSSLCIYLLNHDDLPVNNRGSCCRILIYVMKSLNGSDSWICLLKYIFETNSDNNEVCFEIKKSVVNKLTICTEIVNTVDPEELCNVDINETDTFNYICRSLILLSNMSSADSTLTLTITRGIHMISKILFNVETDIGITVADLILNYVWSYLDYYVDSVRHLVAQILTNIVKFSSFLDKKGNVELSTKLIKTVLDVPATQLINYKALIALGSEYNCSFLLQCNPNIVHYILSHINSSSDALNVYKYQVSTAFEVLMTKHHQETSLDDIFRTWIKPVLEAIIVCESSTDGECSLALSALRGVLLKAVKLNSAIVQLMIPSLQNESNDLDQLTFGQFKCMLVCLNVARKIGYFDSINELAADGEKWKDIISYDLLKAAVAHRLAELRILAYDLIVDSHKTTELFCCREFDVIHRFLLYNINVNVPSFRQKTLGITKKLINRWQSGYAKITKKIYDINKNVQNIDAAELENYEMALQMYKSFLRDVCVFCFKNIFRGANFSRRNISMQILLWCLELYDKNSESIKCDFIKDKHIVSLYEYLGDSYEINKQLALKILIQIPIQHELFTNKEIWHHHLLNTIKNASSVKPTDCITSAYQLELLLTKHTNDLSNLEKKYNNSNEIPYLLHYDTTCVLLGLIKDETKIAQCNILDAAANGPIYGLLLCLRHVLGTIDFNKISQCKVWTLIMEDIIKTCFQINVVVSPIVNNSSPEGHLPMDFNAGSLHVEGNGVQLTDGKIVTAQMVLLCGWRSVKEVSLLLGDISYKASTTDNAVIDDLNIERDGMISKQYLFDIGDHFITLLSETKHRGAFEQAYLGFSKLCLRLWKSNSKDLHNLPLTWLNDLISAIASGDSKASKLCATRRSAGVPYIIQALVTTELQVSSSPQSFHNCMSILLKLAKHGIDKSDTSVETRTHCLNILRALYRHTSLGEQVNPYVAEGLMISIKGFDGATWAERNSSTLLFSSLMTRIFGVQRTKDSDQLCIRNKMTGRIFFLRYPELYDFFLDCLKNMNTGEASKNLLKPSLYPVLLLLSRLYPSSLEGIDSNLQLIVFIPYLISCSGSCVLKIRQLAAKAVVPLINPERYYSHLSLMLSLLKESKIKSNFCHGILLQLIKFLQITSNHFKINEDERNTILKLLNESEWILYNVSNVTNPCFIIAEAYTEMIYLLIKRFPELIDVDDDFFARLKEFINTNRTHANIILGREQFYIKTLHLNFLLASILSKENSVNAICSIVIDNLNNPSYEVISVLLNYLLCIYNINDIDDVYERFEITPWEKSFASRIPIDDVTKIVTALNSSDRLYEYILKLIDDVDDYKHREKGLTILLALPSKYVGSNDTIMKELIEKYRSEDNQTNYVYLKFIDRFLKRIVDIYKELNDENIQELSVILLENSTSDSVSGKMATVDIILNHWESFYSDFDYKDDYKYCTLLIQWLTAFNLFNDEDENVSHKISFLTNKILDKDILNVTNFPLNENRARELFFDICRNRMLKFSVSHTIVMLIVMAINTNKSFDTSECQVFDKGEVDDTQEEHIFTSMCVDRMKNLRIPKENNCEANATLIKMKELIDYFLKSDHLSNCSESNFFDTESLLDLAGKLNDNLILENGKSSEEFVHDNIKIRRIIKTLYKIFI